MGKDQEDGVASQSLRRSVHYISTACRRNICTEIQGFQELIIYLEDLMLLLLLHAIHLEILRRSVS